MQTAFRKILSVLCTALLLFGIAAAGVPAKVSADAVSDYYAGITATGGDALLGQLHDLITTTHTNYTSYSDCRDYGPTTDPALNGGNGIVEFYTHETVTTYIGNTNAAGTWNREHVWPQSLSYDDTGRQLWGTEGGGADMHHLRPSEKEMNRVRGNDKFGEVTGGGEVWSQKVGGGNSKLGGYHAGGVFMPLEEVKGDVARIVLYVYTHYNSYENVHGTTNGSGSSSYFGDLSVTNVVAASSEEAAFELLVAWNKLDPVDAIETTRNEEVCKVQHNRNPFIDHPEYVDKIWGSGAVDPDPVDPDPVTPADNAFTITPESFTITGGYGFKAWSSGGVSGIAYIYGGDGVYPPTSIQFNTSRDSYYLASAAPTDAAIRSVTVKLKAGQKERPWKLLTSDSAYGEVTGKPTNGIDHGTKTVTEEGVTWQLTGDDVYFALTYELDYSGVCYLDSIVVEYGEAEQGGGSGGQGGSQTDESKLNAFRTAVGEIVSEGSLEARAASVNNAIAAYRALSEAERAQAAADVQALQAAIEAYNETVRNYNAAARGSEGLALGAGGLWKEGGNT